MSLLKCPVCGEKLEKSLKSYVCPRRHSFDISSKGYVNLLLSNQMNARLPGDNKMMVNARADFLSKGYYSHLAEAVSSAAAEDFPGGVILDAGCGEGIYTVSAAKKVPEMFFMGTDISKTAADAAAKRAKAEGVSNVLFSVSSVFHLPVKSGSCDMLTTLFAPWCGEEFLRVLKPDGTLIMVIPGERHLWQLKSAIYDDPYLNEPKETAPNGFSLLEKIPIKSKILLDNNADIQNLFSMTPYYYKTSEEGHRRAEALERLETEIEFEILIYKKL